MLRGFLEMIERVPYRRFFRVVAALSLGVHLVVAFRSQGFYQCDEHFQILEFLGVKLGMAQAADLPWEYAARMRSWLLPALLWPVAKLALAAGAGDPFTLARIFRTFSALLAFAGLLAFARCLPLWLPDGRVRRGTLLVMQFFYWVPVLDARTSSENFAQAFFLLGLAALLGGFRRDFTAPAPGSRDWLSTGLMAGGCFGLAFVARFQSAFLVAGATAWLWLLGRERWSRLASLGAGFLAAVAAGALVDRWGYGQWAFPAWSYLRINVLEHAANQWGTLPPWGYVGLFAGDLVPPLGLVWVCVPFVAAFRLPRHLLTWTLAPFVVVHVALAHKETRFLFPTLELCIVLLGVLLEHELGPAGKSSWFRRAWPKIRVPAAVVLGLANAVGLGLFTFGPPRPQWALLDALDAAAPRGFTLYAAHGFAPMSRCGDLRVGFYQGTRRFRAYTPGAPLAERDERGLAVFYGWADTPARLPQSPFAARCEALLTSPWTASPAGQRLFRLPGLERFARRIVGHTAYRCPAPAGGATDSAP
ncbi:MAG TPA: hypothetical protein VGQ57_05920 [Polyangiaceae bacterium]|jgi:hypothetical protein|nr:hypothetical protein [Polyangiaceae bacterium]